MLAGERLFTTVEGPSGRQVVEIDTDTGVYQAIDVRYPDGGRWAPSLYQSRAFGSRIVSVEVPLDAGYVAAWRGDLATGEAHVYRDDAPACIPRGVLVGGPRPELFVATSADRVQGICTTFDDRVCSFVWDLRDDGCISITDTNGPARLPQAEYNPT